MTAPAAERAGTPKELPVCRLRVRRAQWEADGVLSLTLADPSGAPLPPWRPGAHIDLALPSGRTRPYSLCGDPADRTQWTVAVRRTDDGRGGSAEIHETALVGRTLEVRGPRNRFPLHPAPAHLLLAGGIGITPLLPMARELAAAGVPFRLVYLGRTRSAMPYAGAVAALGGTLVETSRRGRPAPEALLGETPPGTAVHCCGPGPMLAAVEEECARRGLVLHTERFAAAPGAGEPPAGGTFEAELRRSGCTVSVPPDRSLLEAVREKLPGVPSSCEEGFCGACETTVLEGEPEHRDSVLDDAERAAGGTMLICVSRSRTPRLVLDL